MDADLSEVHPPPLVDQQIEIGLEEILDAKAYPTIRRFVFTSERGAILVHGGEIIIPRVPESAREYDIVLKVGILPQYLPHLIKKTSLYGTVYEAPHLSFSITIGAGNGSEMIVGAIDADIAAAITRADEDRSREFSQHPGDDPTLEFSTIFSFKRNIQMVGKMRYEKIESATQRFYNLYVSADATVEDLLPAPMFVRGSSGDYVPVLDMLTEDEIGTRDPEQLNRVWNSITPTYMHPLNGGTPVYVDFIFFAPDTLGQIGQAIIDKGKSRRLPLKIQFERRLTSPEADQ